ncbi:hypothetical protein FRB97_002123 [Tulasnella sp. 331]|nr:hypothetical protein FRB97_002123 [Tulasnella sp. 331]KAG8887258.1 hypothetical protein FRB98_000295 [Tulasnella sp. 332]
MDTFGRSVSQASVLKFRPTLPGFFADVESPQTSTSGDPDSKANTASSASAAPTSVTFDVVGTPLLAKRHESPHAGAEDDEASDAQAISPKRLFPVSHPSGLLHKSSISTLGWNTHMVGSGSRIVMGASSSSVHNLSRLTSSSESQRDEALAPQLYDEESFDSDFDISLGDIADDELPAALLGQGKGTGALRFRRRVATGSALDVPMGGALTPGDRQRSQSQPDGMDGSSLNFLFTRSPGSVYESESEPGWSNDSAETNRASSSRKKNETGHRAERLDDENVPQGQPTTSFSWRPQMSTLRSLSASPIEGSKNLTSSFEPSSILTRKKAQRQQLTARKSLDIGGKRLPRTPYPFLPFPRQPLPNVSRLPLRTESPESDLTETPDRFRRPGNPIPSLYSSPSPTRGMTPSTTLISSVALDANAFDQLQETLGDLLSFWCEAFTTNMRGSRKLAARRRVGSGSTDDRGKRDGGWTDWRNQLITCAMIIFVAQLLMMLTVASKGRDAVVDGFGRMLVYRSNRAAKLRQESFTKL